MVQKCGFARDNSYGAFTGKFGGFKWSFVAELWGLVDWVFLELVVVVLSTSTRWLAGCLTRGWLCVRFTCRLPVSEGQRLFGRQLNWMCWTHIWGRCRTWWYNSTNLRETAVVGDSISEYDGLGWSFAVGLQGLVNWIFLKLVAAAVSTTSSKWFKKLLLNTWIINKWNYEVFIII